MKITAIPTLLLFSSHCIVTVFSFGGCYSFSCKTRIQIGPNVPVVIERTKTKSVSSTISIHSFQSKTTSLAATSTDGDLADKKEEKEKNEDANTSNILLPSSSSSQPTEEEDSTSKEAGSDKEATQKGEQAVASDDTTNIPSPSSTTASATFMITRETKRVLIEELGYTRRDTESLKPQIAAAIVSKRMRCPENGIPTEWIDDSPQQPPAGTSDAMLKKLQKESKYPLKTPLLLASTILVGKGLSDLIITLIKVNMGYVGVSLTEEFMGVPVLGIDIGCVLLGSSLGVWTWRNMRD